MKRSIFGPAVFIVFSCLGCMEQYKPWAFWSQLEEERVAAQNHHVVKGPNGEIKTLSEEGILVVENNADEDTAAAGGEDIASVYSVRCAACHGPNGEGNDALGARNFQDQAWQAEATDAQIVAVIKHGSAALLSGIEPEIFAEIQQRKSYAAKPYSGAMPANGAIPSPALTDTQLAEIVTLIRDFAK
ncbi:MAG: c-type cytochrome [Zetaproteobacteria bacterium]|nr:c-type cytochrome [Zetaproteobacteria bacterium]